MNDTYGSTLRKHMKKSMEEPYRPLNKIEPQQVHGALLLLFFVVVMAIGVYGVYAFDRWESQYREKVVYVR